MCMQGAMFLPSALCGYWGLRIVLTPLAGWRLYKATKCGSSYFCVFFVLQYLYVTDECLLCSVTYTLFSAKLRDRIGSSSEAPSSIFSGSL